MTYRDACGTRLGARLHEAAGEPLCADCAHREMTLRLETERITRTQHAAIRRDHGDITPERARANRAALAAAIGEEED